MKSDALRKVAPYIALFLLAAVSIPLFFGAGWFHEFPAVQVYAGPLAFSGQSALADLEALATEYTGRVAGTRAARTSAQWVQERFAELGLNARIEEFDCLSKEPTVRQDQVTELPVRQLVFTAKGYNVVAESPGELDEVVVIGAHRDVRGNIQGAEDNASGTASMLELAHILASEKHKYTYIFVSFDGEEQGLRGSEAFAAANAGLPISLAVSLDMTGFRYANTVGFYPFISRRSASPLWTIALARALSETNNLPVYQFGATEETTLNPVVTFWRTRKERLGSSVPTDTGPFVNRGIPSLGVFAGYFAGGTGRMAPIHGPIDTTEQVSAQILERTGRFVEQYLRSLPLNETSGSANSRLYFVSGNRVLAPQAIVGFSAFAGILAAGAMALTWRDSSAQYGFASFASFLAAERLWIGLTVAIAVLSAVFPAIVKTALGESFTIITFNILWAGITLAGTVAVAFFRQRELNRTERPYHEVTAGQKTLLNLAYVLMFFALLALAGPFAALDAAVFPILALGRVNFRSRDSRVLWSVAALVWIAASIFAMRGRVSDAVFSPVAAKTVTADFARLASWILSAVYIFTTPQRGQMPQS